MNALQGMDRYNIYTNYLWRETLTFIFYLSSKEDVEGKCTMGLNSIPFQMGLKCVTLHLKVYMHSEVIEKST